MKKKFMPSYFGLTLVRGTSRYYIKLYADTKSGNQQLFRKTFKLNRIYSIPERIERGEQLVKKIRFWLDQGYLFEDFDERLVTLEMKLNNQRSFDHNLLNMFERIRDEKVSDTERRSSKRSYKWHANNFIAFLKNKNWGHLSVGEFSSEHARDYVAYWIKHSNVENNNTFNTLLTFIKLYFNVLVDREYIDKNPFGKIKRRRKIKAKRNHFSNSELKSLAVLTREKNVWLWAATQLAFWGLIRQEELSRIKFKMFDFENWCIRLPEDATKNWKSDVITLPLFLRQQFKEIQFFDFPANHFIIGNDIRPGTIEVPERKLNKRFLTVLNRAVREKLILDKTGFSFSSWRRTGMDYFSKNLHPRQFKDHNRHESFSTTEHYLPNRKILPEVTIMKNDIF